MLRERRRDPSNIEILSKHFQHAFSVMQEAESIPRDRRKAPRRLNFRRGDKTPRDHQRRQTFRRSNYDRRGIRSFFSTHIDPQSVFRFLCNFDNWKLSEGWSLYLQTAFIEDHKLCLTWNALMDGFPLHWRCIALINSESQSIIFESLDGDLDVFEGRVWLETKSEETLVHFNVVPSFGLGGFERILGPLFKEKFEEMFNPLFDALRTTLEARRP